MPLENLVGLIVLFLVSMVFLGVSLVASEMRHKRKVELEHRRRMAADRQNTLVQLQTNHMLMVNEARTIMGLKLSEDFLKSKIQKSEPKWENYPPDTKESSNLE